MAGSYSITKIGGFVPAIAFGADVEAAFGPAIDDAAEKAEATLDQLSRKIEGIRVNAGLSAVGKATEAKAAAEAAAKSINDMIEGKFKYIDTRISEAKQAAPENPPPPWMPPQRREQLGITRDTEWSVIQARAGEIRRSLANQFDPAESWAEVVVALRSGDAEVAFAISTAPSIVRKSWCPDDAAFENEIAGYLRRTFPGKYAALDTATTARRAIGQIQTGAWTAIEGIVSGNGFAGVRVAPADPIVPTPPRPRQRAAAAA